MSRPSFLLGSLLLAAVVAAPVAAQVAVTGSVGNIAPLVASVSFGSSFDPTANGNTAVPVTAVITDTNGCSDVNGGASTVTASIVKASDGSVAVPPVAMAFVGCALGVQATFTKDLDMPYHAAATAYKVAITATDRATASISILSVGTFAYTSLVAIGTSTPSGFSFGPGVTPGSSSPANQGIAIHNGGNSVVDATVLGTDLTLASPAATIPVGSIKYSLNPDMSASAALAASSATLTGFDLAAGADSSRTLYLQLVAPSAAGQYVPAGSYTGTLTVGVVEG
ncbi:MAG TPA: hypothetical protein VHI93_00290 [Candidatus Thermoplasmatota archaeon]|nr:hypothetical protein [Candidatus Thermoplasmatota archaeon]